MKRFIVALVSTLLLGGKIGAQYENIFTEISADAGINHAFKVSQATFGGGVVVFDFNQDGYEDLYVTGGDSPDMLYKNNQDGTFTDVHELGGFDLTATLHTQGVASADVNRDGYRDLIITTLHDKEDKIVASNLLYLNNGNGTFSDATEEWGLSEFKSNSQAATFGDINADGYPDLFIANYFASSPKGVTIYNEATIVSSFISAEDYLFLNNNGKGFIEANKLYGIDYDGFGFEGCFSDFDNDRDADILVANDFGFKNTPNVLLRNEYPKRALVDRSLNLVFNYGMNAMGIAPCDYNNDGWMDYFVSNLSASLFLVNQKNGQPFVNMAPELGLAIPTIYRDEFTGPPISWGANFFDFDHDMDQDLFVANGALNPTIRFNYNFFFVQENGVFEEVGEIAQMDDARIARGSAVFDYDRDGDLDLFVVNQSPRDPTDLLPLARCLLYRNNRTEGNWLQVELEGVHAEKNGLGSRVEAHVGSTLMVREIDGGSSHLSQNTAIAHFGLGKHSSVDSVVVKWLGGNTQVLTNVEVNQKITIQEETTSSSSEQNQLTIFPSIFDDHFYCEFKTEKGGNVEIVLSDVSGKMIETLFSEPKAAPQGNIYFEGNSLPAGLYIVTMLYDNNSISKKIIKPR